jgi:hypothetical protein
MNNNIFSHTNWDIRQGDYTSGAHDYAEGIKLTKKDKKKKMAGIYISAALVIIVMLMKVLNYSAAIKL